MADVLLEPRVEGNADPELGELPREIERAGAAEEIIGRPAALHPEAVEGAIPPPLVYTANRRPPHPHINPHVPAAPGAGHRQATPPVHQLYHPQPPESPLLPIHLARP